jgi:TRAP transporter TAXI family solute receptor
MFALAPVPNPLFMELAVSKRGARVLPLKEADVNKVLKVDSSWTKTVIPANSHDKIKKDTLTIVNWYYMVAKEDFPADVVYRMAKTLDTRHADLVAGYNGAKDATAQNAVKYITFKLHPGTARYLKEKGLLK